MFRDNLNKVVQNVDLSEAEMSQVMMEIFSGNVTDSQIGALMAALATKGETFEELAGAARAMRKKAVKIHCNDSTVIDTCGTGGDGVGTVNVSTAAALAAYTVGLVAFAGVRVARAGLAAWTIIAIATNSSRILGCSA